MKFGPFVGFRYFTVKKSATAISVIGVALGTAVLIIVISVMNGFGEDLRGRLLSLMPHIRMEGKGGIPMESNLEEEILRADSRIEAVSFLVEGECLLQSEKATLGVLVRGMDPKGMKLARFSRNMVEGDITSFLPQGKNRPIILGEEIAFELGVLVGDFVTLISPFEVEGPLGVLPLSRIFEVVGIHRLGIAEYDSKFVYLRQEDAADFFFSGMSQASAIEIEVSDLEEAKEVAQILRDKFRATGEFQIHSWEEMHRNLFAALRLEKIAMFLVLSCIVFIASLHIIGTLSMSVIDRQRPISMLMALGARRSQIRNIFLMEGIFIGGIGITLGTLVGLGMCVFLQKTRIISLPEIYVMRTLPISVEIKNIFLIIGVAFAIVLFATSFPAAAAAKIDPIEGIRYE